MNFRSLCQNSDGRTFHQVQMIIATLWCKWVICYFFSAMIDQLISLATSQLKYFEIINPFVAETGVFPDYWHNNKTADALATSVARSSAAIVLAIRHTSASLMRNDFNYLHHHNVEKWYRKSIYLVGFLKTFQHIKGSSYLVLTLCCRQK